MTRNVLWLLLLVFYRLFNIINMQQRQNADSYIRWDRDKARAVIESKINRKCIQIHGFVCGIVFSFEMRKQYHTCFLCHSLNLEYEIFTIDQSGPVSYLRARTHTQQSHKMRIKWHKNNIYPKYICIHIGVMYKIHMNGVRVFTRYIKCQLIVCAVRMKGRTVGGELIEKIKQKSST